MKDMTKGNPMKLILAFAIPVLLGNVFQQFYMMADTMMVGRILGVNALAAMGASTSLANLIIGFASGIAMGSSIMIAQYYGAKDEEGMRHACAGCVRFCILSTIVMTIVALLIKRPSLKLLQTPDSIIDMADGYLFILYGGLCITMLYNMFASMLRAIGDSKTPLYFLIIASISNVILDYLFIAIFSWGIAGAGIATVIAQMLSVVLCFLYIKRRYPIFIIKKKDFHVEKAIYHRQISMGISMGLMNSIVSLGTVILQSAVNSLGESVIAAQTAARKIVEMFMQPLINIAIADTTFVSQNLGAAQYQRIREGMKKSIVIALIWVIIVILISYTCIDVLITLLVDASQKEVISLSAFYTRVMSLFYFVLAILFIYRNGLQGLGNGKIPIVSSTIEMITKTAATFLLIPYTGYLGVALAEPIAWCFMAPVLCIFFYKDIRKREQILSENSKQS